MKVLARAIPRHVPPGMNQTEALYAEELATRKLVGDIIDFGFQRVTLKLAHDTRYTPDFDVQMPDGTIEMHEVKGFWRDDAKVKIKVAARMFAYRFIAVRKEKGYFVRDVFTEGESTA